MSRACLFMVPIAPNASTPGPVLVATGAQRAPAAGLARDQDARGLHVRHRRPDSPRARRRPARRDARHLRVATLGAEQRHRPQPALCARRYSRRASSAALRGCGGPNRTPNGRNHLDATQRDQHTWLRASCQLSLSRDSAPPFNAPSPASDLQTRGSTSVPTDRGQRMQTRAAHCHVAARSIHRGFASVVTLAA